MRRDKKSNAVSESPFTPNVCETHMGEPAPDSEDERILLGQASAGDFAAFSKLVLKHQWSVRTFLLARLSWKHEAEDLAQETIR